VSCRCMSWAQNQVNPQPWTPARLQTTYFTANRTRAGETDVQSYASVRTTTYCRRKLDLLRQAGRLEIRNVLATASSPKRSSSRSTVSTLYHRSTQRTLHLPRGRARQAPPRIPNGRGRHSHQVHSRYGSVQRQAGFAVCYEATRALVIDPVLLTRLRWGSSTDEGLASHRSAGNIYVSDTRPRHYFHDLAGAACARRRHFDAFCASWIRVAISSTRRLGATHSVVRHCCDVSGAAYVDRVTSRPISHVLTVQQAWWAADVFVAKAEFTRLRVGLFDLLAHAGRLAAESRSVVFGNAYLVGTLVDNFR